MYVYKLQQKNQNEDQTNCAKNVCFIEQGPLNQIPKTEEMVKGAFPKGAIIGTFIRNS